MSPSTARTARLALGALCAFPLGRECAARTPVSPAPRAQASAAAPGTPERLLHARLEFPTIGGGKPTGLVASDLDGDGRGEIVVVTSAPSTLQVWSGLSRVMLGWPEPRALPIDDFCLGPCWVGGQAPSSGSEPAEVVIASRASSVIQVIDARAAWRSPKDSALGPCVRWQASLAKRPRVLTTGRDVEGRPLIAAITIDDELAIVRGSGEIVVTQLDGAQASCAAFAGDGRTLYVGFQAARTLARYTLEPSGKVVPRDEAPLPGLPRAILALPPHSRGLPGVLVAGGDSSVWLCGGEKAPSVLATFDGGTVPIALVAGTILGAQKFVSVAMEGQEVVLHDSNVALEKPVPPVRTYAGQHPRAAAIGDFDGDGLADMAIANGDAQRIGVLFGKADGTFDVASTSKLGRQVVTLACGDLDKAGRRDVVSISKLEGTLAVSRNLGPAFEDCRVMGRADGGTALQLADLDGDGALDALFLRRIGEQRTLLDAYFGDGQGNLFQRAVVTPVEVGAGAGDLLVTDQDADGRLEAFVSDPEGGRVAIVDLERVPDAGVRLGTPRAIAVASGPRQLARIDVDGDSQDEIAVALGGPGPRTGVAFLRVQKDAQGVLVLQEVSALKLPLPTTGLCVADCNGDGRRDLVVLQSKSDSDNHLEVWFQSADHAWRKNDEDLPTGLRPYALRMADVDGDAIEDLVLSAQNSHHLNVWLNAGGSPLRFARIADVGVGTGPLDVQLRDLDGDGVVEIVTANGFSNDLSVVRLK